MKADAFWSTFAISLAVAVATVTLFSFLRRRKKSFYIPKYFVKDAWAPKDEAYEWFAWIPATFRYPEVSLIQMPGGFDAVMYLRFLKYSGLLFTALSVIAVAVLLPVSLTSDGLLSGMDVTTLGNIPDGDTRLWVHLGSVFLFSGLVYWLVYKLYAEYIKVGDSLRKRADLRNRTVMVDNLPLWCMKDLGGMFGRMYGEDRVVKATVIPDLCKLIDAFKRRERLVEKLTNAWKEFRESGGAVRPTHRHLRLLGWSLPLPRGLPMGQTVDTITECEIKIALLDQMIDRRQQRAKHPNARHTGIGFVTFTAVATAVQAAQTLHFRDSGVEVKLAPTTCNLIWDNMVPIDKQHRRWHRNVLVAFLLLLLFAGWAAPIVWLSNAFALDRVSSWRFIQWLNSVGGGLMTGVIQGFLSSFLLVLFFAVLPYVIRAILSLHLFRRKSTSDRSLIRMYWLFLLLNLFFISAFTISITDLFSVNILEEPQSYVRRLAQTMPTQADYFTNFVLVQGFVLLPVWWLLRLDDLAIRGLQPLFARLFGFRIDPRKLDAPPSYLYAIQVSRELIIFNIGLFFSSMSVLILPVVAAYFGLEYLIAKHNFIYLYAPRYEDMKIVQPIARRILVALFLYQLFMLGVFSLKAFPYGGAIVPLIAGTGVFTHWLRVKYDRTTKYIPLWDCPRHVSGSGQNDVLARQEIAKQHDSSYSHPALQPPRSIQSIKEEFDRGADPQQIAERSYHEVPPNMLRHNVRISSHGHLEGPAFRGSPVPAETDNSDSADSEGEVEQIGVHVLGNPRHPQSFQRLHDDQMHDVDLSDDDSFDDGRRYTHFGSGSFGPPLQAV